MKNIPLGGNKEYVMQLTHSIRKVVYAMSWAAFIFLNDIQCEDKETYGFRSQKPMPMVEELKDFKDATTQWNKIQSCYTSCIISS